MIDPQDTAQALKDIVGLHQARREGRNAEARKLCHKVADWAIKNAVSIAFELNAINSEVLIHMPDCHRFVEGDMVLFDGIYNCPDCRKKSAERRQEATDWLLSGKAFGE